jgi:serine protease Do
VLTAAHVARRADTLVLELPGGQVLPASVVGYDARRDLALLRVAAPTPLPAIDLAAGAPRAGDPIVVIGAPRGRPGVMTVGEVVANRASLPGLVPEIFLVVRADVAPGNSGGPVLNADGQAVGLVVARGNDGVGLAVSAAALREAMPGLRRGARIERPWMGVAGRTASPELVRSRGLGVDRGGLILEVVPASPAAAANLEPGDVIVAIDDRAITSWEDVLAALADREPGQRVRLAVARGGARLELQVTLGVRP